MSSLKTDHIAVDTPRSRALTAQVEPIDAAMAHHLASSYWDWRTLYEGDESSGPLMHPDVVLTDLVHNPFQKLAAVLVRADGELGPCGIGTLVGKQVSTRRLGGLAWDAQLQGYRLAGNEFAVHADVESTRDAVVSELLNTAMRHVVEMGAGFLLIEDLDEDSSLARALSAAASRGWSAYRHAGVQSRRRIAFPKTPEEYWAKFSSKTRQTFRRKLKKFGNTRLERIDQVADVPRFLEAAHSISTQTWQTRQFGLRVRNDNAELGRFHELAQLGFLRCYLWHVENRPVAFTIGFQDHGRFYYEEVGYLPEFARFSPGQMMLIQMIDDLMTHRRVEMFDFGGGDADYKQLFSNQSSRSGTVWLFPPGVSHQLTCRYLQGCQAVRRWGRGLITRFGDTSRWRQWIRRGGQRNDPTARSSSPTGESSDHHHSAEGG